MASQKKLPIENSLETRFIDNGDGIQIDIGSN